MVLVLPVYLVRKDWYARASGVDHARSGVEVATGPGLYGPHAVDRPCTSQTRQTWQCVHLADCKCMYSMSAVDAVYREHTGCV